MQRKALVVGETGLIGRFLVDYLLRDKEYDEVVVLTRREFPQQHFKLDKRIVDFENLEQTMCKSMTYFARWGQQFGKRDHKKHSERWILNTRFGRPPQP